MKLIFIQSTYCEDSDGSSYTFTQQLLQLLFG